MEASLILPGIVVPLSNLKLGKVKLSKDGIKELHRLALYHYYLFSISLFILFYHTDECWSKGSPDLLS